MAILLIMLKHKINYLINKYLCGTINKIKLFFIYKLFSKSKKELFER